MIRQATIDDLNAIAKVHKECFPESFSSALGIKLLTKFYYEYLSLTPELFLVSVDDDKLNGFCMGYYMECDNYMKSFIRHNFINVALVMFFRLITFDKRAWRKVLKKSTPNWIVINHKYDDIPDDKRGDLLSICVLKEYRGKGIANELIMNYQNILKSLGRKICMLSVDVNNDRGIHFYEKHGFILYREASDVARTYIKLLEERL